jgi:hypothetical protein
MRLLLLASALALIGCGGDEFVEPDMIDHSHPPFDFSIPSNRDAGPPDLSPQED